MYTSGTEPVRDTERASEYNYRHFGPEHYDFGTFDGPSPGDEAPEFRAWTVAGEEVRLSEFRGSWVVLETGSLTCPITDSKVRAMDELAREFEDAVFVLLYTREAHPGEQFDAHESLADKLERARSFAADYGVERTVLVDDVEGTAHRKYGGMPNSVHVITPDGVVAMRGDWNHLPTVRKVLETGDENRTYDREIYRGRPLFFTQKKGTLTVLRDAGPRAVRDFLKHAPALALMHLKKEFRGGRLRE